MKNTRKDQRYSRGTQSPNSEPWLPTLRERLLADMARCGRLAAVPTKTLTDQFGRAQPSSNWPSVWGVLSPRLDDYAGMACETFKCRSKLPNWVSAPLWEWLLAAGLASSTAVDFRDTAAWGFLVEHQAHVFARQRTAFFLPPEPAIRAIDESADWPSRLKGLFAERFAMGAAVRLLWEHFGIVHVADVGPMLRVPATTGPFRGRRLRLLPPTRQQPDFIGLTAAAEGVIVEVKGALGKPSAIPRATLERAKNQTRSIRPVGFKLRHYDARLAFAVTLLRDADTKSARRQHESTVRIEDPPGDDDAAIELTADPNKIALHSYCKFLAFGGLGDVARTLLAGKPAPIPDLGSVSLNDTNMRRLSTVRGISFLMERGVCEALFSGEPQSLFENVSSRLRTIGWPQPQPDLTRNSMLIAPNGTALDRIE